MYPSTTRLHAGSPPRPALAAPLPSLRFDNLSQGARCLLIEHAGQVYRLSLTAQNKLILTK